MAGSERFENVRGAPIRERARGLIERARPPCRRDAEVPAAAPAACEIADEAREAESGPVEVLHEPRGVVRAKG